MILSQHLFSLTIVFFYKYARGCFALNGHVTYSPDSLISYSRFLYHVPPARELVHFLFVLRVSSCTSTDCQLVSGYLVVSVSPFVLSTRLYAYLYWLRFPVLVCRFVSRLAILVL